MEWLLVIIGFCSALAAVFSMVAVFRTAKATEKICSLMDTISEREKTFDITNRKKEAYYQLMGNRYSMVNEIGKSHILSEQRYYEAINICEAVFSDSPNIIEAFKQYHDVPNPNNLSNLCELIAVDLDITFDKHRFIHPVTPKRLMNDPDNEE